MKKVFLTVLPLIILSFLCLIIVYINILPHAEVFGVSNLPIVRGYKEISSKNEALNAAIAKQESQLTGLKAEIEERDSQLADLRTQIKELEEENALYKQNAEESYVMASGFTIKLMDSISNENKHLSAEAKYEMIHKGVAFTIAVLDNDESTLRKLCTSELYDEYLKSAEVKNLSAMSDTQRLFCNLKGKTLSRFDLIVSPFYYASDFDLTDNGYILIIHYSCKDFDDGLLIQQHLGFKYVDGEYLISSFGRDA